MSDLVMTHNTVIDNKGTWPSFLNTGGITNSGLKVTNNLMWNNQWEYYGIVLGDNLRNKAALDLHWQRGGVADYSWHHNLAVGHPESASLYPTGNFWATSSDTVGFVNFIGGNYALRSDSPYYRAGDDGKDVGVDFLALDAATRNTESGGSTAVQLPTVPVINGLTA